MLEKIEIVLAVFALLLLTIIIVLWLSAYSLTSRIFAGGRRTADLLGSAFLRGNDLYCWARETAIQIVSKHLGGRPKAATPIELSRELHDEATRAMFPWGPEHDADLCKIPCPEEGQGMIGITAPEVLEVVEYIQQHLTIAEKERIHDLAKKNVEILNHVDHTRFDATATPCPLQGRDGVCLVYAARPLRCRPLHAATVWRKRGVKRPVDQVSDYEEQIIEQGAETGLTEALAAAGRDAKLYELNSALLVAMDTPDAAQRWAEGEDIFQQCKRYE